MSKTRNHKSRYENEQFTKLNRKLVECPAFRALSPVAKALYPYLKLEWKGPGANNNDSISLSVRQAAERLGVAKETARKAFHDLQAKGFLAVTQIGHPGLEGFARCTQYRITELPRPGHTRPDPEPLYTRWDPAREFEVTKATAHNPSGRNGKQNPNLQRVLA